MGRGLACLVTAASLGAALAGHTVGAQCMGLELLSFHHTAELTDVSSFTEVTCALQVKDPQSVSVEPVPCPCCQLPGVPSPQLDGASQDLT